ncbi:MAG: tetratricopeptide repeat protein [Muribaculaceae bacterium]|nr:tetratricopeptide repeat protein [Muribaculaceae bacterium]
MKIAKIMMAALALAVPLLTKGQASTSPEIFSPLAKGYIERSRAMSGEGNYAGVIDQLRHLDTQQVLLTASEAEEYTFLLAEAYYERGDEECVRLLTEFAESYPASYLAPKASLAMADFYFFRHDWARALEAFDDIDFGRLNREEQTLYTYRKGLCMIRSGYYKEARPLINRLKDAAGYADAYNFYTAYLDYIDGDYDRAYTRFMKVTPGIEGLDAGYYMTQIEYKRGEYENVINHGNSLLRKQPQPELAPELQRIVGLSYFHIGEPAVAEGYLESYFAKTEGTPEADALYAMGAIDYANGRYGAAINRLSEITDRPDAISQGAWLYLGQCYLRQDNPTAAALAFEKASRLDYDRNVTETALYNYVTSLTRGGKVPFSSSSDLLESFVRRFPDSEYTPEVEGYLATAYYNDRNYEKALGYINAIRHPSAPILDLKQKVLYELGVETLSNGNPDKAAAYLRQCVALKGRDKSLGAQASLWLGDALYQLGRYKEARQAYSDFIKEGRSADNRALGYYDLAYTQYKLENYKEAASDFASALSARPPLPARLADDAVIRRADCLYYTGSYAEAAALYTKAIDSGATDADYALYRRAIIKGLSGETGSKLGDLTRLERDFPQSRWLSKALLEQALTYEETGRRDLAADAYKKRLSVATDVDIDELLRMAATMNKASRWSDLLNVVERIRHAGGLEADELSEIDLYEADALRNSGRKTEAVPIYEELARNVSSQAGSKAVVMLAEIDNADGEFEKARVRMEEFTDAGTPHQYWLARGFIALADAYKGLGQTALAKEYLNSLMENYPGDDDDIASLISTRQKKWK